MNNGSQERSDLTNAWGLFAGLLMGGLIGAGTMLLLAPRSGKKTRAKIQQEGLQLRGQVSEIVEDAVVQAHGKAHQISASVSREVEKLQRQGQEMLSGQKGIVSEVVEAEKTAIHNMSNG